MYKTSYCIYSISHFFKKLKKPFSDNQDKWLGWKDWLNKKFCDKFMEMNAASVSQQQEPTTTQQNKNIKELNGLIEAGANPQAIGRDYRFHYYTEILPKNKYLMDFLMRSKFDFGLSSYPIFGKLKEAIKKTFTAKTIKEIQEGEFTVAYLLDIKNSVKEKIKENDDWIEDHTNIETPQAADNKNNVSESDLGEAWLYAVQLMREVNLYHLKQPLSESKPLSELERNDLDKRMQCMKFVLQKLYDKDNSIVRCVDNKKNNALHISTGQHPYMLLTLKSILEASPDQLIYLLLDPNEDGNTPMMLASLEHQSNEALSPQVDNLLDCYKITNLYNVTYLKDILLNMILLDQYSPAKLLLRRISEDATLLEKVRLLTASVLNMPVYGSKTLLHHAIFDSSVDKAQILIDAGADINVRDDGGNRPLSIAVFLNRIPLIQILIDAGADINVRDDEGNTLLHEAILQIAQDVTATKILIDAGADINVRDDEGNTPLHVITSLCCNELPKTREIFNFLLENRANPNIQNNKGNTPLHIALKDNNINATKTLIENRANLNIINNKGKSSLDYLIKILDNDIEGQAHFIAILDVMPRNVLSQNYDSMLKKLPAHLSEIKEVVNEKLMSKYPSKDYLSQIMQKQINPGIKGKLKFVLPTPSTPKELNSLGVQKPWPSKDANNFSNLISTNKAKDKNKDVNTSDENMCADLDNVFAQFVPGSKDVGGDREIPEIKIVGDIRNGDIDSIVPFMPNQTH